MWHATSLYLCVASGSTGTKQSVNHGLRGLRKLGVSFARSFARARRETVGFGEEGVEKGRSKGEDAKGWWRWEWG